MSVAVTLTGGRPVPAESVADLLSAADRHRLAALHRFEDRARFATGRALLRLLVARETGESARAVRIDMRCPECGAPHGRPQITRSPALPPLHAAVSHAGAWVLVAVAGTPVGVDVEPGAATAFAGFDAIALTPAERAELAALPPERRADARTWAWVTKEAVLKLHGVGLRREPAHMAVGLSGEDRVLPDPLTPGGYVALRALPLDGEHRAALAVSGDTLPTVNFVAAGVLLAGRAGSARTTSR